MTTFVDNRTKRVKPSLTICMCFYFGQFWYQLTHGDPDKKLLNRCWHCRSVPTSVSANRHNDTNSSTYRSPMCSRHLDLPSACAGPSLPSPWPQAVVEPPPPSSVGLSASSVLPCSVQTHHPGPPPDPYSTQSMTGDVTTTKTTTPMKSFWKR